MKKPVLSSGTVWFQPPNKFRREVKGNSPSVTVSDGRELWIYYPNFKSAERYPLGKGSPLDATVAAINSALNLENIETSFNISATKSDTGHELALLPRTAAMKRVFQKLDLRINDKFRVEGTDMLLPNGDRIVTTYSNQTRAPIPPSTFEFKPPRHGSDHAIRTIELALIRKAGTQENLDDGSARRGEPMTADPTQRVEDNACHLSVFLAP